tara:strand:- start:212 stop:493 length:282 start_codon:yes stop_codon:yes gene_type:complete
MGEEKVYINGISIKEHTFGDGNSILKVAIHKDGIKQLEELTNEEGWVNVDIKSRREVSEKGQTHYMELNTYKPKQGQDRSPHDPGDENDSLPF